MKKIFILSIIFLFTGMTFAESCPCFAPNPDFIITITLNFHSRKSNCTSGFGFCKVSITFNWELDHSSGNPGEIQAQAELNSKNQLIFRIQESELQQYDGGKSLIYFKGKKSIYVDDTYELSQEIQKALGSPKPLIIRPGEYKLDLIGTIYIITIPQ